jgi:hypothetical protein
MSPRTGGKAGWHLIFSIIGITGGGSLAISMTWRFIWGRHVRESVDFIDGEPECCSSSATWRSLRRQPGIQVQMVGTCICR